jgi:hypothetical protein
VPVSAWGYRYQKALIDTTMTEMEITAVAVVVEFCMCKPDCHNERDDDCAGWSHHCTASSHQQSHALKQLAVCEENAVNLAASRPTALESAISTGDRQAM